MRPRGTRGTRGRRGARVKVRRRCGGLGFRAVGHSRSAPLQSRMRTLGLFFLTAVAEIVGCYLPYLWLKQNRPVWLLLPSAVSLALFAWLLTLHGTATGRVYAAYGGVYICVALGWLWIVDKVRPTAWDVAGALVALCGMAIIMFQPST